MKALTAYRPMLVAAYRLAHLALLILILLELRGIHGDLPDPPDLDRIERDLGRIADRPGAISPGSYRPPSSFYTP